MVMRPKSRATVVVVLRSTPSSMSTFMPGLLRDSSVRSGRISLTAPTSVVLPAPKPPATRSLRATGTSGGPLAWLEPAEAISYLPEYLHVGQPGGRGRVMNRDELERPQVGEEDLDHAQRQVEVRGKISNRGRQAAHRQQGQMLRVQADPVDFDASHGGDQRDEVEDLPGGPGPATG